MKLSVVRSKSWGVTLIMGLTVCTAGLITYGFQGCGGGSSSSSTSTTPAAAASTGIFVDSPVQGLGYKAVPSGLVGQTDATGHYQYMPGDMVTFNLGGRPIGISVTAVPQVTALSIFDATSITDPSVVNLSQLLGTLAGGLPNNNNPIVLPSPLPATLPQTLPNFSNTTFATQLQTAGFPLTVSDQQALAHLQTSFKTLSVTVVNSGTVTSNPTGINCTAAGTCSFAFVAGTPVTLTATGNGFTGWNWAGCGGTGTCMVTMNADAAVTATFPGVPPPVMLTILPNQGTGTGAVTCNTTGGAPFGACVATYPNGTALILQGAADNGSTFGGWIDGTGNATGCNTTTANCSMTLTADTAVRGNFVLNTVTFSLTANKSTSNGGGGTIACSTTGGAPFGVCTPSYNAGTNLTLQAMPNSASNFSGWGNGSGNGNGSPSACNNTTGLCIFTMTANSSITANFNLPVLTVVVNGAGFVSSTPGGINNCTTNCSAPFNKGNVTLSASGASFPGWSVGGCTGTSSTCLVSLTADTTVTALFSATTGSIFPLTIDPTSRYLVDHNVMPFPILGRTAWFITSLSETDYKTFIDDTVAKGYNAIEFHVVNHDPRGNHPPFGFGGNGALALPFTKLLNGSDWDGSLGGQAPDFTKTNETYWTHVDALLAYAESKGVLCFMFPAYTGYAGGEQGWMAEMTANGVSNMTAYGAFIANRYKTRGNIVWMLGGDYGTGGFPFTAQELAVEQAMLVGMKSIIGQASVNVSAEWNMDSIYTDQTDATLRAAGTLEGAYSFRGYVNTYARNGYAYSPIMPTFLLEEPFDEEGPDGTNVNPAATQPVRRFQWWGWLSGIGGYISGNGYVWPFNASWQAHLNTQGAQDMARLNDFVRSIAWYNLVPSGLGGMKTLVVGNSSPDLDDYVAAAATPDGTLLVAYVPPDHSGSITVDMTVMSGLTRARWFNPASAAYTLIGSFPNIGTQDFTPPGDNGTGFTDWILLLETQ